MIKRDTYQAGPFRVRAYQWPGPGRLLVAGGDTPFEAWPGDYVVTGVGGVKYRLPAAVFEACFYLVPLTQAAA